MAGSFFWRGAVGGMGDEEEGEGEGADEEDFVQDGPSSMEDSLFGRMPGTSRSKGRRTPWRVEANLFSDQGRGTGGGALPRIRANPGQGTSRAMRKHARP